MVSRQRVAIITANYLGIINKNFLTITLNGSEPLNSI